MGRKAVTEGQLTILAAHFRDNGTPQRASDWKTAAQAAGLDVRTVRRAWDVGLSGKRPLRDTVAESQTLARARLTVDGLKAERDVAPLLAASDAADQAAREANMSRAASTVALELLESVKPLAGKVQQLVTSLSAADVNALAPADRLALVKLAAVTVKELVATAGEAFTLERRRVGDPTSTLRVEHALAPPRMEDVVHIAEAMNRALERQRMRAALPAALPAGEYEPSPTG